jgi:leukotriene-A4 hydrolase
LQNVDAFASKWDDAGAAVISEIPWSKWSYEEQYRFLSQIKRCSAKDMTSMDQAWKVTTIGNNEVLFKWLENAINANYQAAYDELEVFLMSVGRRKFVQPLFEAMVNTGQTEMANKIYKKARANYHSVTTNTIDELLQ